MKKGKIRIHHGARTDVGRIRESNEDRYVTDEWLGIYAIADGMGGHAAGEVASRITCESVVDFLGRPPDPPAFNRENLIRAVEEANRQVFEAAQRERAYAGMGTTLVLVWVRDDRTIIAHVGDSRLYVCSDHGLSQITTDHEEPITGYLTSAIGVASSIPRIDLFERQIVPGETYLLASDGLFSDRKTKRLDDKEIEEVIRSTGDDPEETCTKMVDSALENSGDDNITVVLLRVEKDS